MVSPPLSDILHAPASILWGVNGPSKIKIDGEWRDEPKWVLGIGDVEYRFYRTPRLYSNPRVSLFLRKMRKKYFPTLDLAEWSTGWEESAQVIYHNAYRAAKAQLEE